jgi:hypothetical protein
MRTGCGLSADLTQPKPGTQLRAVVQWRASMRQRLAAGGRAVRRPTSRCLDAPFVARLPQGLTLTPRFRFLRALYESLVIGRSSPGD